MHELELKDVEILNGKFDLRIIFEYVAPEPTWSDKPGVTEEVNIHELSILTSDPLGHVLVNDAEFLLVDNDVNDLLVEMIKESKDD